MADKDNLLDKNGKPLAGGALMARQEKLAREKNKTSDTPLDKKIEEKVQQALEQPPKSGGGKKDYGGGTRLAQLYRKSTDEGSGTVGGIFKASKERLKEKLDVRNSFGSGLLGAVGEKTFGKGYNALKQGDTGSIAPTPASGGMDSEQMADDIGILTKNSMAFPGIARDVNVIRQNIVKITNSMVKKRTKVEGKGDSKEAATKADMYFLKADEQEAKLEAERAKLKGGREKKSPTPESKKEEGSSFSIGGIIQKAVGWLKDGLFRGLKALFKPSNLLKTLGRVFVIGTLIAALVNGIMDGWKTWQETGDLGEAIISGLAGIVDFLTFGLFNKDDIKDVFRKIGEFLDPVIDTISAVVTTIKDWIVNNVGIPEIKLPTIPAIGFSIPPITVFGKTVFDGKKISAGPWEMGSIGPWYPFKSNPKSSAPETSAVPKAKEVPAAPAAEAASAAATAKKATETEKATVGETGAPASIGKEQKPTETAQTSTEAQSVSPTKEVQKTQDDQSQVFKEKASFFAKKRDEELSRVEKLKKTRDQAAKDGASPDQIASFNSDINKSITAAGDFERQRIEVLMKAGETPKPEIKVPDEIKKSTDELRKALGGDSAPSQLPTMGDINVASPGSPTVTQTTNLGSPEAAGKSAIKEEKPSIINALSDSDAKSIFSESASSSPTAASGGGGDSMSAAMAPTGETSSSPAPSLSGEGGGGQTPSLSDSASSMPTGATISESSSQVAEEQRTEMSMSEPTIINNAATNNTNGTVSADNKSSASVVDDVFAEMVAA